MSEETLYSRFLSPHIVEALADSPGVLIHGPRQCGKTTLARLVADEAGIAYFTFDDDLQREAAKADPVGFVADLPERAVLDEVQRVPELFTSLKAVVDTRRKPGLAVVVRSPCAAGSRFSAPGVRYAQCAESIPGRPGRGIERRALLLARTAGNRGISRNCAKLSQ
jgi:hypothetical protein